MRDYAEAIRDFSIETLEREVLLGSLDQGLNACVECCDRWASGGRVALEWFGVNGDHKTVTYESLKHRSSQLANYLSAQGVGPGDVVAGLLPRIPDLLVVVLGAWRLGAIYQPLFTAFGPSAIETRVTAEEGSRAKLIVTDAANRPKLDSVRNCPAVLVVGGENAAEADFASAIASFPGAFAPVTLRGEDPFVVLFTSGTTGKPKGVRYPLKLLLPIAVYMRDALDLKPGDNYWNLADPGWGYGMVYAIVGPLLLGHATTLYEGRSRSNRR